MSQESYQWLRTMVLAGFKDTRMPWWANGDEPNLFPAEVPMERVEELLTSWSPRVEALYTADMKEVTSHKLITASDNGDQLGVVGAEYAVHAYGDWLTGTVSECVGDEAKVSSAGLLRKRAQAWVTIERPESAKGPDGIMFSPYVTLSESLDGSLASQVNQNTRLVVCDNTLAVAREQGLAFWARHTKGSSAKLGLQRSVVMAIMAGETSFKAELERQLSVKVPDDAFSRFLDAFIPVSEEDGPAKKTRSERKRQEITQLYRGDPRVQGWKGTEFGVVQAVNTWQTHMSQLKNTTGYEMDDTNLRAMRNYASQLRPVKGDSADQVTMKVLEGVL
jgi:phage/plasmid-like protein (TIGR03299 family)